MCACVVWGCVGAGVGGWGSWAVTGSEIRYNSVLQFTSKKLSFLQNAKVRKGSERRCDGKGGGGPVVRREAPSPTESNSDPLITE